MPVKQTIRIFLFSIPSIVIHSLLEYTINPLAVAIKTFPSFVEVIPLISLLGKPLSELYIRRCYCKKVPTDRELGEFANRKSTKKLCIEINRIISK